MQIGYIILAHTLPEQLVRLVRRLSSDHARFFIHVDRRADEGVMRVVEQELGGRSDVQLLPRHRCEWATFDQVDAELEGVHAVLAHPDGPAYGVLLTGQDYPLRPPAAIEEALARADGRSFMQYWPATGHYRARVDRWNWHRTIRGRHVRIPNRFLPLRVPRRVPGGLDPYTGWAYWCLSRECLAYVADFAADRPDVVNEFRRCGHPDEAFFQTILLNSPLAATIVNDDLRYIDWSAGGASPRVLTSTDLDALRTSPDLFARKFDARADSGVLDALDAHLDAGARRLRQ